MVACKWSDLLRGQGLNFAAVIDQRIQAYNKGRTEAVAISQPEKALIKLYVHQAPESTQLLEYQWPNFKICWIRSLFENLGKPRPLTRHKADSFWCQSLVDKHLVWTPAKSYYC
jgi:hypothetical protein